MIKLTDISEIAMARPESPALVCTDYSLSWRSVEASVSHLAAALCEHIDLSTVGQAVFISKNRIELILMMAAFSTIGVPLCGIDYTLDAEGMRDAMRMVGADCVVISTRQVGSVAALALRDLRSRPVIDLDDALDGAIHLSMLTSPCRAKRLQPPPSRPARIVAFTSGTSGAPKPTLRTASTDARRFGYFTRRYGFHADDRYLLNMPLYHVAGSGWARHFMGLGAAIFLAPVDQPTRMADIILRRRVTAMVTTPFNLAGIISAFNSPGISSAHALRFVLVGGKSFGPSEKAQAIAALGPVVHEYYGSTETGVNTIAEPDDLKAYPASVGRPYEGNRIIILDEKNNPLPVEGRGRIAVSSYLLMDGYIGAPANEVMIEGVRFLVTPDRGYLDQESRLYVLNRASGAVGNLDVYTIENALRGISGVRDVAVITGEEGHDGVSAYCALVLDEFADKREAVSNACAILACTRLACREVRVIDHIPHSLSGKVRWSELAALMSERRVSKAMTELV
jgi:acyl-coenzyme A synthetase/AMP-(fatty) acid ligase